MAAFPTTAHGERLLALLKAAGISKVVVDYSGSGDSGNIDGATCFDANEGEVPIGHISLMWLPENTQVYNSLTHKWDRVVKPDEERPLEDILRDVCNDALEDTGLDWYNNDGGQGQLVIEFESDGTPRITLDVGVNIMSTEDHTFAISPTGEVLETEREDDDAS